MSRFLLLSPVLLLVAAGCNSVYFYETSKISLTAETKPDPSAPVTGNFGLKDRIVLVTPPTRGGSAEEYRKTLNGRDLEVKENPGDAVSVISSVRVSKGAMTDAGGGLQIDTGFVTGRAARLVARGGMLTEVIASLGGQAASQPYTVMLEISRLRSLHRGLRDAELPEDLKKRGGEILAKLDSLDKLVPPAYPVAIYVLRLEDGRQVLVSKHKATDAVDVEGQTGFDRVLTYWSQLIESAENLESAAEGESDEVARLGLQSERDKVMAAAEDFGRPLRNDPATREAREFWISIMR